MIRLAGFALIGLLFSSAGTLRAGTVGADGDLSGVFADVLRQLRGGEARALESGPFDPRVVQRARAARWVLVPGFMSNGLKDYFGGTRRRLEALGVDAEVAAIDSEADRAGDLERIEALVAGSDRPLVLIGHSRGGALLHDWYRGASPAARRKVAKLVLLQAPLRGTPVVDFMLRHRALRAAASLAGRWPGVGDVAEGLVEMSTPERERVLAGLPPLSSEDLSKIYVVATVIDRASLRRGRPPVHKDFRVLAWVTARESGGPSDGVIALGSTRLPGAKSILVEGMDHEDTVLERPGLFKRSLGSRSNPDRPVGDFTEALLRVLFSDVESTP